MRATDPGGLSATDPAVVNVIYNFSGFFQPVDSLPVRNMMKAGRGVSVKFSLSGDHGLNIFASGYPVSQKFNCDTTTPLDDVEQTLSVGQSSLSYDPITDRYSYTWKTNTSWAGTCRTLIIELKDSMYYRANFQFK